MKIKQEINIEELEVRDGHSIWNSEISEYDMCTDQFGKDLIDDEDLPDQGEFEREESEEKPADSAKPGWGAVKNIINLGKTANALFTTGKHTSYFK
jgi:hypothetical protein